MLFFSPVTPICSFTDFQRQTGMDKCGNSQGQQENVFLVSTTTGVSKRQISLSASPYALHLPVSCKPVFTMVCVIHTCSRRRGPTFSIKTHSNLVYTEDCVSAARTPVSPREMQELPTPAFCTPEIPQLSTKEDQGF